MRAVDCMPAWTLGAVPCILHLVHGLSNDAFQGDLRESVCVSERGSVCEGERESVCV